MCFWTLKIQSSYCIRSLGTNIFTEHYVLRFIHTFMCSCNSFSFNSCTVIQTSVNCMGAHSAKLFFLSSIFASWPNFLDVLHLTMRSLNSLGVTKNRTQKNGQEALGKEGRGGCSHGLCGGRTRFNSPWFGPSCLKFPGYPRLGGKLLQQRTPAIISLSFLGQWPMPGFWWSYLVVPSFLQDGEL